MKIDYAAGYLFLIHGFVLQAAGAQPSAALPATPDAAAIEFLLSSAAKDFKGSGVTRIAALRNTRVGYLHHSSAGRYVLCGTFRSADAKEAKWTAFATIKTSDYEQWIGGVAESICRQKSIKWYGGDHSATLLQRVRG